MNTQRPVNNNGRTLQSMLPPTSFVLLPHHLQLLRLLELLFTDFDDVNLPHSFILHIYRLLLLEIMNVIELN